eukprot:749477_1
MFAWRMSPLSQLAMVFLMIISTIYRVDSETISCTSNCRCYENNACTINCKGEDACKDVTLTCKSGFDCTVECDGKASCSDTKIDASDAVDAHIHCKGEDSCKGDGRITCGSGDCLLKCSSSTACEDTKVYSNDARSFQCIGSCNHQRIPDDYSPSPTSSPTPSPTASPSNAPSQSPSISPTNAPTYLDIVQGPLYDVVLFGFSGFISNDSSVSLTLWFAGGLYKCDVDSDETRPYHCIGSDSWVHDRCYVNEARSQMLFETENSTEVIIESVFVNTTDELHYFVNEFCLFDVDMYRDYDNDTFTQFYYGSGGMADCLRDEPSSQELVLKQQSAIISFDLSAPIGMVEDGSYIDAECKRMCCGTEQDVIEIEGLIGWYKAIHFDVSNAIWTDASPSKQDITTSDISGGSINVATDYIVLNDGVNITFPQTFNDYTLFFVNQGGSFSTDCSSIQEIGVNSSWNVNTHRRYIHRANGVFITNETDVLSGGLCITNAPASGLNLKELIVYDTNLHDADIECIESYLGYKYEVELTRTISFASNTDACVEYQFIDDLAPNVHDAENLCLLVYGVHLASIHSLFDYEQAFHLCTLESYRCFLGGTDYDEDCVWEWMDDTSFNWNQWQTGEGCNRPQNNICIFPMFWDEEGFRDCHGSGAGYAICDRLMEAGSTRYLNKTYLNVIFKVCDTNTSRNLDEFIFELDVRSDMDETLTFGASSAECFGLETNASEIIYCYFHHDDMMQGAVTQLDLQSNNADAWCFDAISIGVYDHIVPFDETQCPFNTNSSCDFWKLRSEALAADYYLSRFVSRNVPLGGGTVAVANQGQAVNRNTKSNQKTLVFLSNQPKINTLLLPTTPAPTLPTNSPSAAPTGAPTVSNTHVWITFDVCNSLQNVYEQFNFGFSLVGTTGATSTVDSKQHCIEDEEDYSQLECFMHYANFIDDLIELSIQPISGVDWCFDGVIVRIADRIADVTDFSDDAQVLFLGDYSHSHFIETDLSNQVNEGVILSTDCFHSFYERDDGALIQCFDDLFTLYPYKPRQQLAIKFHTCSVRDSGMDSSSLAHIYLDVLGKERNQTNGEWISMEKPVTLSHFPRSIVDSGKVHWEHIGVLVASNVDIDIANPTKVYFHHEMEGILVGIKYRVNTAKYWQAYRHKSSGQKYECGWAYGDFDVHVPMRGKECLQREECDGIIQWLSDDSPHWNCLIKNIGPPEWATYDEDAYLYYLRETQVSDDTVTSTVKNIHFTYPVLHGSEVTLSRVYPVSSEDSLYIQLADHARVYIRVDEAAEVSLPEDQLFVGMNIDVFYVIKECEWTAYHNKELDAILNNGGNMTTSAAPLDFGIEYNTDLCFEVLYEAQVLCARILTCNGVSYTFVSDENTGHDQLWCCMSGLDLKDAPGVETFVMQCDLNYEMPYASVGTYFEEYHRVDIQLRSNIILDQPSQSITGELQPVPYQLGWYNMEKWCIDRSTHLASIHSTGQNLAARLSGFVDSIWVGLSATEPLPKLDDTTDVNKTERLGTFAWSDGTSYSDYYIAPRPDFSTKDDCAAITYWETDAPAMNLFETFPCDYPRISEGLCSSYGWPSNEYRTFIVNIDEPINEISMIHLSIDEEQNNNICIDEAVLLSETLYNAKYERAWLAQNWIGNPTTCDECIDNAYAFFKDPVCEMTIVDITYDMDNKEVLETDEQISGFECENHNRFASSECTVDQTYTYTEELSSSVSRSQDTSYSTSSSVTITNEKEWNHGHSDAWATEVGVSVGKDTNMFGGSASETYTREKYKGGSRTEGDATTTEESSGDTYSTADEEGVVYSTENSVTCSASISVGKGIAQSYNLRLANSNLTIPTTQDLKLTLCTEYFPDHELDDDAAHVKYIDNLPGRVMWTTTTSCKVEFTAPYRLRNDYACNEEQAMAFLEQVTWIPLCNKDNPALYDGCQCVTGDKLTESACACADVSGNPLEDGKALIVDAVFGWENTCRVLNCADSVYAGQEVVVADTETNTGTNTDPNTDTEVHDYRDIASSIRFVGFGLIVLAMTYILKGSRCDLCSRSVKHAIDFQYKKTAVTVDSDSELEDMDHVL